ncbi:hypothetical protein Tco_1149442, partial [Tanacetum coccineum]
MLEVCTSFFTVCIFLHYFHLTKYIRLVAPTGIVSRSQFGAALTASFRDVSGDSIHRDFFPFSPRPYYATYPEGGIDGKCEFSRKEWDDLHQPTRTILTKEVFRDPSICKTVVDPFPTPGSYWPVYIQWKERKKKTKFLTKNLDQLNADISRLTSTLNQATVVEAERDVEILRLKSFPPKLVSFFRGGFQSLVWKFLASDEFSRVQGDLLSLAANASFEGGLRMHRTPEEFDTAYSFLNKISDHVVDPLFVLLQLEPKNLAHPTNVPSSIDTSTSSLVIESTVNEDWMNVMVDVPENEMTGDVGNGKPIDVFVHGISHAMDGSGRVYFDLSNVVIQVLLKRRLFPFL